MILKNIMQVVCGWKKLKLRSNLKQHLRLGTVNFALREWVPHGRRARACVCGDGQTPHVSVTSLLRAVKAAEPRAKDWWFFECRRAHPATVVRAPSCPPCNRSQGPTSSTRPAAPTPQ